MNLKVEKLSSQPGTEYFTVQWHFLEDIDAVANTGEVRYYSDEEIAQYIIDSNKIKENHNENNS